MNDSADRRFDLVALDLDGTILDLYHHKPFSRAVRDTINAVQDAGVPVTIVTGRTLDYVREHVAPLGIVTPVVTTQGAVVGDPISGKILHETTIPLETARRATAWIDAQPYITSLYFLDPEGRTQIYQNHGGPEPDFYDHVFTVPRHMHSPLSDLVAGDVHPPLKFLTIDESPDDVDLVALLKELFSPDLYITRTHPRLVEGTAPGLDKGQGLLQLCALLKVNPERVLAIGDSDNDIPVLEAAGYAVAMGNSTEGVAAVADWHAPPIEEDGAAVAMRRFVLEPMGLS
ncbi:MAG: HAD family hydrolase [Caldilineaceae bacterium]